MLEVIVLYLKCNGILRIDNALHIIEIISSHIYFILIFFSVISEILLLIPTYLNGKIIDMVLIKDFQSIIKYLEMCIRDRWCRGV